MSSFFSKISFFFLENVKILENFHISFENVRLNFTFLAQDFKFAQKIASLIRKMSWLIFYLYFFHFKLINSSVLKALKL